MQHGDFTFCLPYKLSQDVRPNFLTNTQVSAVSGRRTQNTIIIIIFINCNWVVTRWQWLLYMYTNMKKK